MVLTCGRIDVSASLTVMWTAHRLSFVAKTSRGRIVRLVEGVEWARESMDWVDLPNARQRENQDCTS